ncbi:MAG: hypothetical protein ACK56I_02445, partial [bacterium]
MGRRWRGSQRAMGRRRALFPRLIRLLLGLGRLIPKALFTQSLPALFVVRSRHGSNPPVAG